MPTYVGLLRAVNVGGTGKLPMNDLRALCEAAGFEAVRTYIASGNVVFRSELPIQDARGRLEERLAGYAGKPVGVVMRTAGDLTAVLAANPFPDATPNRVLVTFLNDPLPRDAVERISCRTTEEIVLADREIYVHYLDGMGNSKLSIAAARPGTARNLNTVAKLVEMSAAEA
ncbi:MAG: DUF1697 domain-containing protein [Dehalococcoidia bacterium]